MYDVTLLTCKTYYQPTNLSGYVQNVVLEYQLLKDALEARGLKVDRTYWDNPDYDWSSTKAVVVRTIWDYFERYDEFNEWLKETAKHTRFINPISLINWNIDKHYLADLEKKEIAVVPTYFVDKGKHETLATVCKQENWSDVVIKPAISGAAFHTYKIKSDEIDTHEELFKKLVAERDMLVQPFFKTIATMGEASLMVFNGRYTHAILKKTKPGDFRVQDDFGGTVHPYKPLDNEIDFAEKVFAVCETLPAFGRADIIWDEAGNYFLSELEIIEPELWVRNYPPAAVNFAKGIIAALNN